MFFFNFITFKNYKNNFLEKAGCVFLKRDFRVLIGLAFLFCSNFSVSFGVEKKKKDEIMKKLTAATMFCTNATENDIDPCVNIGCIEFRKIDFTEDGLISSTGKSKIEYIKSFARRNFVFKVRFFELHFLRCKEVFLELGELGCNAICELDIDFCSFSDSSSSLIDELCKILETSKVLKRFYFSKSMCLERHQIDRLLSALGKNKTLEFLDISRNRITFDFEGLEKISKCTTLRQLSIADNSIIGNASKIEILENSTKLKLTSLDISGCSLGDSGIVEVANGLINNKTLISLDISNNMIHFGLEKFLDVLLEGNTSLKELDLSGNGLSLRRLGPAINKLSELLKNNKTLTRLFLSGCELSDIECVAPIAAGLRNNNTLRYLDLSDNGLREEGASEIAKSLKNNTSLLNLDLSRNNIGNEGAIAIAAVLKNNNTLRYLDLSDNEIGEEGVSEIAKSLINNTSLLNLDLSRNLIRGVGAIAIADALKNNTSLLNLDLSGNNIGDEGAIAIADVSFFKNKALEHLDISYNGIGKEGVKAIAVMGGLIDNKSLLDLNFKNNP